MKRILFFALLACLMGLLVSGCSMRSATDLYRLPKITEDYVNLESKTEEVLSLGAEYCAPLKGSNRQSVQLVDLNGDDVEEAVAFFKLEDEEKPLRVYIFRLLNGVYTTAAIIEADGNAFDMIEYAQLDGEGYQELLIGTRINSETQTLQVMNVYSINSFEPALVDKITYSTYSLCDMDQDNISELLSVSYSASSKTGKVNLYEYNAGTMTAVSEVQLSEGIERLYAIRTGYLSDMVPAVFLTSVYNGSGWISDIIAMSKGTLKNITYNSATGCSTGTIVNCPIGLEDINSDQVIEIPRPVTVPEVSGGSSLESCYMVTWQAYSSTGRFKQTMVTFHNLAEDWYIDVTGKWEENIVIDRYNSTDGTRSTTFYIAQDIENLKEIMRIYVFTGDNRFLRANTKGLFKLDEQDVTVYAAEINDTQGLTEEYAEEQLALRFSLSSSDWNTGVIS